MDGWKGRKGKERDKQRHRENKSLKPSAVTRAVTVLARSTFPQQLKNVGGFY